MEENKENKEKKPEKEGIIARNFLNIVLIIVVFLLGFVAMGWPWWQASTELKETHAELTKTTGSLKEAEIFGLLTTAIVAGERGDFDSSLRNASDFFTRLRAEMDRGDEAVYTKEQQEKFKTILNNRDETIAKLALKDESGIRRLNLIFDEYNRAVAKGRVTGGSNASNTSNSANIGNSNSSELQPSGQANSNSAENSTPQASPTPRDEKPTADSNTNSNTKPGNGSSNTNANGVI